MVTHKCERSTVACRLWMLLACVFIAGCGDLGQDPGQNDVVGPVAAVMDTRSAMGGREIFRYDDFGDWQFWTGTLRLHELVSTVTPLQALELGLKVDIEALSPDALALWPTPWRSPTQRPR